MRDQLFRISPNRGASLQSQIREALVAAILDGHIPPGSPVPSGRKLARQLEVARNTVVLAYQQLVDEGYLVARERSGYYVAGDVLEGRARIGGPQPSAGHILPTWLRRLVSSAVPVPRLQKPDDWQRYPFPFIYGQIDPALFPIADWRECCREAASVQSIHYWARDTADRDDPLLIEQLRTRVLPRRGVWAAPDEILVTLGAQHGLYLLAQLLTGANTTVAMEEPGYFDARNVLSRGGGRVVPAPVDQQGLKVDDSLRGCDCVYVTPSHQSPTTVTMPLARREALLERAERDDFVIIEDDYESETNFVGDEPTPALKSLDRSARVIYLGSLSKTLAPGLRMGFMVAPAELIREARALRHLMLRHPPANNQQIVAQFLARGHHDSLIRRLSHAYRDRWRTMGDALTRHLPHSARIPTFGGTSFWVEGPADLDSKALQQRALDAGILIECGDVFFMADPPPLNFFRLGFSSISADRIEPGIRKLAALIR